MKPQRKIKENTTLNNLKKTAKIIYLLKLNKITQKQIAETLNITTAAVSMSINGKSTITRVDNWLKENIGDV